MNIDAVCTTSIYICMYIGQQTTTTTTVSFLWMLYTIDGWLLSKFLITYFWRSSTFLYVLRSPIYSTRVY